MNYCNDEQCLEKPTHKMTKLSHKKLENLLKYMYNNIAYKQRMISIFEL